MIALRLPCALLAASLFGAAARPTLAAAPKAVCRPLVAVLEKAVAGGSVVGAQLAIGDARGTLLQCNVGRRGLGRAAGVDENTLFCIGSCSKPVASVCILTLVDAGTLGLDDPVSRWLPAFGRLQVQGGGAARHAPTVRELLAHRGGVYTQQGELTREQLNAIRNYTLTLEQSVALIARQKLIAQPSSKYAYSGAGYCVVGRAAEVAADRPFEELLQEKLCRPLGLKRTTYFPGEKEKNIALPGKSAAPPHSSGANHRLPLIGGGLYSTATDMADFARMVLSRGQARGKRVLSRTSWREIVRRQFPGQDYSLGWRLGATSPPQTLAHSGALGGCRSTLHIDLAHGCYFVALWTLADASERSSPLPGGLIKAWQTVKDRLPKREPAEGRSRTDE